MSGVWHRAGGQPTFAVVLDWRVSFMFLFLIVHARMWTFALLILMAATLSILSRFGYTLGVFYNRIRSRLAGDVRVSRPWWWRRRFIR